MLHKLESIYNYNIVNVRLSENGKSSSGKGSRGILD